MTVSAANPPFNEYTAAPGATVFPYTFKIIKSDDMKVLVYGVAKQIGVDYTLSGVGANDGGNVTFLAPMVGGENVVARMDLVFDRQTDYQQNGDFLSPTVNGDYDRLWLALQQIGQSLKAAIKLPFTTTAEQSINQSAAQRANTVLAFDASGNLTISTTDADNVIAAQAAAAAAQAAAASIDPANLVHRTGNETIGGVKTFSSIPVIGTASVGSSDGGGASTAFVAAAILAAALKPNSVLSLTGGGSNTLSASDFGKLCLLNSTSANATTLPAASAQLGGVIAISNINTGLLTINRAGTDTISGMGQVGSTSLVLAQGESIVLLSVSGGWVSLTQNRSMFNPLGTYQDYTASRALGTNYTNTSRYWRIATGYISNSTGGIIAPVADGILLSNFQAVSGAPAMPFFFLVRPGGVYSVTLTAGSGSVGIWREFQ